MKRIVAMMLIAFMVIYPMAGFAANATMAEHIRSYEQTILEKGEIGWEFNRWKTLYNEAMKLGEKQLFGTRKFQAVVQMTLGVNSNYESNYEKMKGNKFLAALAQGDAYDYGLNGVTYLAKAYAKTKGQVQNDRGIVVAEFSSSSKGVSWSFRNHAQLAKELNVTVELIMAWANALTAYQNRNVYNFAP